MTHNYGPLVDPADVPSWMSPLISATAQLDTALFRQFTRPPAQSRSAAVLMLLGSGFAGPDILLLQRSAALTDVHAGQVAFPGGATDPGDDGPVHTALREANEEVGVQSEGVRPVALLPQLYVPVSGFLVTPVLAHWSTPTAVRAVDPAETAGVARVPIADLVDPGNRIQVRHPSGMVTPAYVVSEMLIWGFTAALLTAMLTLGGWDRPWDTTVVSDVDEAWQTARARLVRNTGASAAHHSNTASAADAEVAE